MKKKIFFYIIIFSICINTIAYAEENEDVLKEQMESTNISGFINESKKYSSEILDNVDVGELINSAIKGNIDNSKILNRVLNVFGQEVRKSITTIRKYYYNYFNT